MRKTRAPTRSARKLERAERQTTRRLAGPLGRKKFYDPAEPPGPPGRKSRHGDPFEQRIAERKTIKRHRLLD
jgi:hypothetical protein